MKSFDSKTILVTALVAGLITSRAFAQTAKDVVGWWTVVSVANETDGKKIDLFGSDPKGYAVFDGKGHFAFAYTRPDLPKFASSSRSSGTASENEAIVQGSLSYFGTYTYNEGDKTLTLSVDASTFPNWIGKSQKRTVTVEGDKLTLVNRAASTGSGTNTTVFRRRE